MLQQLSKVLSHPWQSLRSVGDAFTFRYNDKPFSKGVYYANAHWFKWIYNHYFKIGHYGDLSSLHEEARQSKVMVLSNHANTLEAYSIYYYFYLQKLGMIRALVFPGVFRMPFFRELLRSARALPVNVSVASKALVDDHLLIFPEGMEFIQRYLDPKHGFHFHTGFLQMAKKFLEENKKERIVLIPVAHDGFDDVMKFWVINNPLLVKGVFKPVFGFPYAVMPKLPLLMPAKIVFVWGSPVHLSLKDINSQKKIERWKRRFELKMEALYEEAKILKANS